MSINQLSSALYSMARLLRWFQAGKRCAEQRSLNPLLKRIGRVAVLRGAGRLNGKLFR